VRRIEIQNHLAHRDRLRECSGAGVRFRGAAKRFDLARPIGQSAVAIGGAPRPVGLLRLELLESRERGESARVLALTCKLDRLLAQSALTFLLVLAA
jgi:hypothetical protein